MKNAIVLSKSKIKEVVGCELMLFNTLNNPKEKVWDKSNLAMFEQGRVVEAKARAMFPNGVLQNKVANKDKVTYTQTLLKTHNVLFEASFVAHQTIIQFDVLSKNADGSFDAVEVKSSSKFKPDHEIDVLLQYWIATHAGIKINNFEVWFVNRNSTGGDNYFSKQNVMEFVTKNEAKFWELLTAAQKVVLMKQAPEVKRGAHCDKLECPFRNSSTCKMTKVADSVLALPRFAAAWDAQNKGITSVNDPKFDETYKYAELNPLIVKSVRSNQLVVDRENLMKDFSAWKFPLNFFDFETLMGAVPVLKDQKPFDQVAFQYSNHVFNGTDMKLEHTQFLHLDTTSPDQAMIQSILNDLEKNDGSIVAYNKSFEQTRIRDLAERNPEFKVRLLAIVERFVDLMDLVKDNVYHPAFMGSYSLKVVSPTLLGEFGSYSDSLIKSGSEIAAYYTEMITTSDLDRKDLIKKALEKYCFYDTLNLFLVLQFLINPEANIAELVATNLNLK